MQECVVDWIGKDKEKIMGFYDKDVSLYIVKAAH
jgi:hypothetical protein